jgi:hypothetical protein
MTYRKPSKLFFAVLVFVLGMGCVLPLWTSTSLAQYDLGGDKKKKDEDKPQFPRRKFKGTILSVKLEERRFLLDTEGLAVLIQVDDKTKLKLKKDKKGAPDFVFADLKKGDEVEVSGQLPPTRILEAEKVILLSGPDK